MTATAGKIRRIGVLAGVGLVATGAGAAGVAAAATAGSHHHTLRVTTVQIGERMHGKTDITANRDTQHGKTTGYDVLSCQVDVHTHQASCDFSLARVDGLIIGHATVNVMNGKGSGRVTGGTSAYRGARGTATVQPGPNESSSRVTLSFRS